MVVLLLFDGRPVHLWHATLISIGDLRALSDRAANRCLIACLLRFPLMEITCFDCRRSAGSGALHCGGGGGGGAIPTGNTKFNDFFAQQCSIFLLLLFFLLCSYQTTKLDTATAKTTINSIVELSPESLLLNEQNEKRAL